MKFGDKGMVTKKLINMMHHSVEIEISNQYLMALLVVCQTIDMQNHSVSLKILKI